MNMFLWILQIVLALHTAIGAGWKFFNSEQNIPSLSAIPHGLWIALTPFELICAAGLIAPAIVPSLGILVPIAAIGIAAEMLVFSGVHLQSGEGQNGPMFYWLGVAAICAITAVARLKISPL
ncbi:DoxX family protein [Pararhizobium sp. IMCC21322]|uniref:DoxX family protein n=1 Tax=Pararhizobium sp. IMCC21322 TaxID=3067903 RepID=UPI002741DB63|nr:DoxX family protein [Pararhizobium sp. IMCC21322]